ncbi:ABC transporter ATP-binding protein [Agromyces aerolatus]|uniref:ABC transporter ATP-binding protein n=1 Tax=Agromyces sp. LY-1074 TaxID=3074080 RepID=UPI0028673188|nr:MULTISPECIES: ABC transporter ATP-binding protein [unclassified Agromyces]MDR5700520.1 ABC transporter ATP-binding protein [Agromyces sp. LY-1074]MDR5707041.1 ABC transporter ATP-binding protein [Agromyces sp. LY-1358]
MTGTFLAIEDLTVASGPDASLRTILAGLTLEIAEGRRIGLVGESGSGKTMAVGSIVGLLPSGVRAVGGSVKLDGRELLGLTEAQLRTVRGREIAVVYQNALSSLNPVIPVGRQIADVGRVHLKVSKAEAMARAIWLMGVMGIPDPERRALDYPHQFSGGMAQRVSIAMALVAQPRLIIADEPTTGLDATIQAQVLETIAQSVAETGAALLLISHDLVVVESMTDEIVVLYAGVVLEQGPTSEVMADPLSPYTKGLVASVVQAGGEVSYIPGRIPEPGTVPVNSCPFAARCPLVTERCRTERPMLREIRPGRRVACHNVEA